MTKSSTHKAAAGKASDTDPKTAPKVPAGKESDIGPKTTPKAAAGMARAKGAKIAPKAAAGKESDTGPKTAPKAAAGKESDTGPKTAPKAAAGMARDTDPEIAAQFEEIARDTQIPDSMRALAEKGVAQTRQLYERSKNTLQAVIESWEKSFVAAGQGAVALNRKIIDIAERNINTGFDLATSLAGAKNLAEAMELQAAYWRKQFRDLSAQAEEVRALSTKVTANVVEPINSRVTVGMDESLRRIKSTQP